MHALKGLFNLLVFLSGISLVGSLMGLTWECIVLEEGWKLTLKFAAYTVLAGLGCLHLCETMLVHAASSTAVKKATTRAEIRAEIMQEIHVEATAKAFKQAEVDRQAEKRRQELKGTLPTVQEIMESAKQERKPE